jgi:UDP-N-acetylmuramate--alanine ligase
MEMIGTTENKNILISDYGHHPTEITFTLEALRSKYPTKKIFTIFQPHQYSRTLELLEEFKNCFQATHTLIIPDIYESRDSEEDKKKINSEKLIELIKHPNKQD